MEDPPLRERLKNEVLETCLADNVKAWHLRADGNYARAGARPARRGEVK